MTTEEMQAIPVMGRVKSIQAREIFVRVADTPPRNDYRASFRKQLANGNLSGKITLFHGKRIEPVA